MPSRTPTPCRKPGCGKAHTNKHGYCDAHKQDGTGWNQRRSAWQGKGSTRAWRKIRKQIFQRDDGLCVPCHKQGRVTAATEVDHIVNKASGGTDHPGNLQSICKACHKAKTAIEGRGVKSL